MKNVLMILVLASALCYSSVDVVLESGAWQTVKVTDDFSDETVYKIIAESTDGSVAMLIPDDNWFFTFWESNFSRGQSVDFRVDDNEAFEVYCSVDDDTHNLYGHFDDDMIYQMLCGDELMIRATFANGTTHTARFSLEGITACYNEMHAH